MAGYVGCSLLLNILVPLQLFSYFGSRLDLNPLHFFCQFRLSKTASEAPKCIALHCVLGIFNILGILGIIAVRESAAFKLGTGLVESENLWLPK